MRRVARGRRLRRQLGGACMHRRGGLLARGELGLELVQGVEGLKWSEGVEVESLNALHQLLLLSHFRFDRSATVAARACSSRTWASKALILAFRAVVLAANSP